MLVDARHRQKVIDFGRRFVISLVRRAREPKQYFILDIGCRHLARLLQKPGGLPVGNGVALRHHPDFRGAGKIYIFAIERDLPQEFREGPASHQGGSSGSNVPGSTERVVERSRALFTAREKVLMRRVELRQSKEPRH